ncbi:spike glycoprotein [Shrew coronavirus]|uniref:Spike glycoprotein n=1 Tax=Common shrew coronavirus Tibet-2014 TaxID=2849711 RepID=A0A2H4MXZ6_9ALPC|nr:spike glycoprotein [Shrew coronavirus]ATP66784.1 spike glycoprotein [Common shrew coronavirus Tibet-2014]
MLILVFLSLVTVSLQNVVVPFDNYCNLDARYHNITVQSEKPFNFNATFYTTNQTCFDVNCTSSNTSNTFNSSDTITYSNCSSVTFNGCVVKQFCVTQPCHCYYQTQQVSGFVFDGLSHTFVPEISNYHVADVVNKTLTRTTNLCSSVNVTIDYKQFLMLSSVEINSTFVVTQFVPSYVYNQDNFTIKGDNFWVVANTTTVFVLQPKTPSNETLSLYIKITNSSGSLFVNVTICNYFRVLNNTDNTNTSSLVYTNCVFEKVAGGLQVVTLGVIWRKNVVTLHWLAQEVVTIELPFDPQWYGGDPALNGLYCNGWYANSLESPHTYLLKTNASGHIVNSLWCNPDDELSSLQCAYKTFNLNRGVYSRTVHQKVVYLQRFSSTPKCVTNKVNADLVVRGGFYATLTNCDYDLHGLLNISLLPQRWGGVNYTIPPVVVPWVLKNPDGTSRLWQQCVGVDVASANTQCFKSISVSFVTNAYLLELLPGQCVSYYGYFTTGAAGLVAKNAIVGTFDLSSGDTQTCMYQQQNTTFEIPQNVCVSFTFDSQTIKGILTQFNTTYPSNYTNILKHNGVVKYVRIDGVSYVVKPCLFESVVKIVNNATYNHTIISTSLCGENGTNTTIGCIQTGFVNETLNTCDYSLGNGFCANVNKSMDVYKFIPSKQTNDYVVPISGMYNITLPTSYEPFTSTAYYQTRLEKLQVDCQHFVCDSNIHCLTLLQKYGDICTKITGDVNTVMASLTSLELDALQTVALEGLNVDYGSFNFSGLMPQRGTRSFIEDLLFDKIVTTGPQFYKDYYDCHKDKTINDLLCAQQYNGMLVVPPIMDDATIAMYGTIAGASVSAGMFGGQAGMITWNTAVSARLNALGITQEVMQSDIQKIANAVNGIVDHVSNLAKTVAGGFEVIQAVVNQNGAQMMALVDGLQENFGAISNNFETINNRLNKLEADQQMDRLINGRLNVLQSFMTNYKIKVSAMQATQHTVNSIIKECVYAQSTRNGFCGDGKHIMSFMQNAPDGIFFIHFTMKPVQYINVTTTPGLCINNTGIAPKDGIFVFVNGTWMVSPRNIYNPRNVSNSDIVHYISCEANYTLVNNTIGSVVLPQLPNIGDDFNNLYENTSKALEEIKNIYFNFTNLNLTTEIERLNSIAEEVKKLNITLSELGRYERYVKWPWYVWLAIAVVMIVLVFILGCLLFMTGCCGCCGCCGGCCGKACSKPPDYEELEKLHVA